MDPATPSVAWIAIVSSVTTLTLVGLVATMLVWNQRRISAEAKRWGQQVLAAQEAERRRVAKELHDDLVQKLQASVWAVERGESASVSPRLHGIIAQMRTMAHALYPATLAARSFTEALADLVNDFHGAGGVEVHFTAPEVVTLPVESATALYRVTQEALVNAVKHADADTIHVTVEEGAQQVTLTIADDGCGIPTQATTATSFGLRSMRERLDVVGGTLEIAATTPHGTRVVARVPRA